jgi:outer membrane protein assembly factor BamD (BamD/ComL family)
MIKSSFAKRTISLSLILSLVGCAFIQSKSDTPPPAPIARAFGIDGDKPSHYRTEIEKTFSEGLNHYNNGNYNAAIKKFNAPVMKNAWPELQIRNLKYLAFSYCLINDLQECERMFTEILRINPQFKLLPQERGHPVWGTVFEKVQQTQQTQQAQQTPQK